MTPQKRPFIAGNWKMHGDASGWLDLSRDISKGVLEGSLHEKADIAICPPHAGLALVYKALMDADAKDAVKVGGQNIFPGHNGPFTGEVSGPMLKSTGCKYVIIGHSERRQELSETDAFVAKKTIAALEAGLTPILCVGEGEDVGDARRFITRQLTASLEGVGLEDDEELIIAYEPIWAISTAKISDPNKTVTPDMLKKVTEVIRETLKTLFGEKRGADIRILYGGSMKGENAAEIMAVPEVDGGLIGGASLKADDFLQTIKNAC